MLDHQQFGRIYIWWNVIASFDLSCFAARLGRHNDGNWIKTVVHRSLKSSLSLLFCWFSRWITWITHTQATQKALTTQGTTALLKPLMALASSQLTCWCVTVCIIGSLGNLLVCVAVGTNPRLRRSSNLLLFSLAIADLIVTMVCQPIFVAVLVKKTFFNDCALSIEVPYLALSRRSCTASVAHMAAISVDRFITVVFPLRHRHVMGNHAVTSMLVMSWTLPISVLLIDRFVPESFPKGFLALHGHVHFILSYHLYVLLPHCDRVA